MPFLDGFAEGFTSSFNAMTNAREARSQAEYRRSQSEREIEASGREERRVKLEEEEAGREAQRHRWAEEDRPLLRAATEAETKERLEHAKLLGEQAAEAAYKNTPEYRALLEEELKANTDYTAAKSEGERATARVNISNALINEWKMSDEGKQMIRDEAAAAIRLSDAQAEQAGATAAQTRAETERTRSGPGLEDFITGFGLWQEVFPDATIDDYRSYVETGAIPEGMTPGVGGEPVLDPRRAPGVPAQALPPVTSTYTPTQPARPEYTEAAPPPAPSQPMRALGPTPAVQPPAATQQGPTAGPATRTSPIPYAPQPSQRTETYREQPVTTPPPRAGEPRLPTPRSPVGDTYRAAPTQAPSTAPRPMYQPEGAIPGLQPASYTPGAGRVIEAQAGTRNQPLNDRTRSMLEQASAATGLDVRVTSGAQPSSGPGRTGSHRHDVDVGSGDIQLIDKSTGKPVSMETPEGQQRIIEFMRAARDAGATGFGAGVDYMGPETIHVGFGDPAVWGAGGKSANAPDWLVAGMSGEGGRPSAIPQGTGARPTGVARAYQGLQQLDMPQMQAAVLAGNIQQESNGDPNSVNAKEGAEGIIQWRQDRLQKLKNFAGDRDYRDLNVQLDFLVEEGERLGSDQDKAAWQEFMSATTPEAANAALKKFIRYGDNSEGTRLEYAENLLRSGGGEIVGERQPTERIGGRQRMPTPRGEVRTQTVNRQALYSNSILAAKEGAKYAVQQAGFGGPMPAITDVGTEARVRGFSTGQGAAAPQEMAKAREAIQRAMPRGAKLSKADMNALVLATAYHRTARDDPEKAQAIAAEIYQNYKQKYTQFMGWAQMLAKEGRLNEAAQMAAEAYAYIPDGQEAKFTTDQNGNFFVEVKGPDGRTTVSQLLTPEEMYGQLMGWGGPVEFDRRIRAAAGMQSAEFERQFSPEGAIPPIGMEPRTREPGSDVGIDWSAMNQKEGEAGRAIITSERAGLPKAFTVEERAKIEEQLATAQGEPATAEALKVLADLFVERPAVINGLVQDIADNSDTDIRTIVSDLAHLAQSTPDAPNIDSKVADDDYVTIHVTGSPAELKMGHTAWQTIEGAINRKMAGMAANAPPDTSVRDADTAAERAAIPAIPPAPPQQYGPEIPAPTIRSPRGPASAAPFRNMPSINPAPAPGPRVPMTPSPRGPTPIDPYRRYQ